jgi:hypothetical protein
MIFGIWEGITFDFVGIRFTAFAMKKNAKRELSFFFIAARVVGRSPKGSKGSKPAGQWETPIGNVEFGSNAV